MTPDTIRALLKRQPFKPFTIHMNDGRSLSVNHPDFVLLPPDWSANAIVALPNDRFEFVYLRNIASLASEGDIPALPGRQRPKEGDQPEV
jgi:hypothetical protein